MKMAILSITANRSDLSKITKREILSVEEVDEDSYFSTLVDIGVEHLSPYVFKEVQAS